MSDLIRRADAVEVLAQQWLFEASAESPYVNDDDIGEYRKLAEELFEDVPSAEAEWIPCSERLPDIDTPVIICTASGGITDGYRWNEKDWFLAWSEYNGWHDGNDGGRITAWMPLPKPYREESEVKE